MERFWTKVKKTSGCWYWIGCTDKDGYGRFALTPKNKTSAHRSAWVLLYGDIPKGMHVLHRCDVPNCVNPDHLYLGDHSDNMQDMVDRRRRRNHKLSRDDVIEIRRMRNNGFSINAICDKFKIHSGHACAVANGKYFQNDK